MGLVIGIIIGICISIMLTNIIAEKALRRTAKAERENRALKEIISAVKQCPCCGAIWIVDKAYTDTGMVLIDTSGKNN